MIGTPNPGEHLDQYRIDKFVSRSGMATILRGTDTRSGQRSRSRFRIRNSNAIRCSSIAFTARPNSAGNSIIPGWLRCCRELDPSRVYMVMEWVEGRLLREILD